MTLVCTPLTADSTAWTADTTVLTADMTEYCVESGAAASNGAGGGEWSFRRRKRRELDDIFLNQLVKMAVERIAADHLDRIRRMLN